MVADHHLDYKMQTRKVHIRDIFIGGDSPILIQSMTNTDTADPKATAEQIMQLADAGSEIVRITVNNEAAAKAVPEICQILEQKGYEKLPIVGDFHFNGHKLLQDYPEMAKALDKYRINPGNCDYAKATDDNFTEFIKIAIEHDKAVRIGANWGSLDQKLLSKMMDENAKRIKPKSDKEVLVDALVESAFTSAIKAEELGLEKIILSVKMSDLDDMVNAYEKLAARMLKEGKNYPLHLGLTEAGSGMQGLVSSSAALAILLRQGIGDTIRISLTPEPNEPRTKEVEACKTLLQSLGIRNFQPKVTSCPGCGRTDSNYFQELASEINAYVKDWQKKYPRAKNLKIAVMGCVVNGPGESKHADIAISLPGKSEEKMAPVYIDGKFHKTLQGDNIKDEFTEILEDYIKPSKA